MRCAKNGNAWFSLKYIVIFPATAAGVDFVNYNGGNGGDYHLQSSSPYKNAAMDGKDLGADVSGLMSAIAGVK